MGTTEVSALEQAKHRLKPSDDAYGTICPECAAPKHRQSKRCAACYTALRRAGAFPPPPSRAGQKPWNYIDGRRGHRATGRGKGRPQSQSHPWRGENALLFLKRRVNQMADAGTVPATAGGRMRAHFGVTS